MKKSKTNEQINPDPYEDLVRLENLDAYESLIKFNSFIEKNNKSIEKY